MGGSNWTRIGPGWRALPHFRAAYSEAEILMSAIWRNDKYGKSRRINGRGRKSGHKRWCDRFETIHAAIACATKVILRDRYHEVPPTCKPEDLAQIGRGRWDKKD